MSTQQLSLFKPRIVAAAAAFAVALAIGSASTVRGQVDEPLGLFTPNPFVNATVDAIEDNPQAFVGQVVRVSGEVEGCQQLPPGAFRVEDSDPFADETVLVLRPGEQALQRFLPAMGVQSVEPFGGFGPLGGLPQGCAGLLGPNEFGGSPLGPGEGLFGQPDEIVQVIGLVRLFQVADFEQAFGVDLDDNLFGEFEGRPYIVAFRVDGTALTPGPAFTG